MKNLLKLLLCTALITLNLTSCKKNSSNEDTGPQDNYKTKTRTSDLPTGPQLGVNYNEGGLNTTDIKESELDKTGTRYVRGILNIRKLYDWVYVSGNLLANHVQIKGLKSIKDFRRGEFEGLPYRSVVSLRFNYENERIPLAGSTEFINYMNFLKNELLPEIMSSTNQYTDIIVANNEPFIQCMAIDKDSPQLGDFCINTAITIGDYMLANNLTIPLFLGSFDGAWTTSRQANAQYLRMLDWAKTHAKRAGGVIDYISGVDLHIHHKTIDQITTAMNFIQTKIAPLQQIIITEYSVKSYWDDYFTTKLSVTSPTFIATGNYPQYKDDTVEGYIVKKLNDPAPLAEWGDFNRMSPFLSFQKSYICESFNKFKAHPKFFLATYAMRQDASAGTTAVELNSWVLNGMFVDSTVKLLNGNAQPRIYFFSDFKALRDGTVTSCAN